MITSTSSFARFSNCPLVCQHEQSSTCITVQRSEELSPLFAFAQGGTRQFFLHYRHRCASEGSPPLPRRESGIPLLWSTNSSCAVLSLASTSLAWPDPTVLRLHLLQLLLHNHIHFSYCSPLVSASAASPGLHPLLSLRKVQRSHITSLTRPADIPLVLVIIVSPVVQ